MRSLLIVWNCQFALTKLCISVEQCNFSVTLWFRYGLVFSVEKSQSVVRMASNEIIVIINKQKHESVVGTTKKEKKAKKKVSHAIIASHDVNERRKTFSSRTCANKNRWSLNVLLAVACVSCVVVLRHFAAATVFFLSFFFYFFDFLHSYLFI